MSPRNVRFIPQMQQPAETRAPNVTYPMMMQEMAVPKKAYIKIDPKTWKKCLWGEKKSYSTLVFFLVEQEIKTNIYIMISTWPCKTTPGKTSFLKQLLKG